MSPATITGPGRTGSRRPRVRGGTARGRPPQRRLGRPAPNRSSGRGRRFWKGRVKERELVGLCQHLSALSGSGISLAECLETFAAETANPTMRQVMNEIIADLEAGRKLSAALELHPEHFSAYFRASIWAGEASGNMTETLDRLARYLENRQETRQRVRNAFAYPVVLSFVIVGVVTFLMLYVVPVFAGVYRRMGIDLPLATRVLTGTSSLLTGQPWVLVVPVVGALGASWYFRKSRAGRLWLHRWKVRAPIVGPLLKQMTLYRFMRAFGEMMGAGVPVLESLDLAGRVTGNVAFDRDLEAVRSDVKRGLGLTEPLRRTGWFTPSLLQVVSTGEQSGRVPALLTRAADILQRDIDMTLKRVVGRIEPLLTVGLAALVGLVLLAVYLPMFDVMQHVGQ